MIALEEMVLPGAEVESEILEFLGEAEEHEWRCEERDESLIEAFEAFTDMASRIPQSITENWKGSNGLLRIACYSLVANVTWESRLDRRDCIEGLAGRMKKSAVVEAMAYFGACVNEYYRLHWIVAMYGGWRKEGGVQ